MVVQQLTDVGSDCRSLLLGASGLAGSYLHALLMEMWVRLRPYSADLSRLSLAAPVALSYRPWCRGTFEGAVTVGVASGRRLDDTPWMCP